MHLYAFLLWKIIINYNLNNIYHRKKYVCHHSDFQKVPKEENKKGNSKNAMCQAYIRIM